MTATQKWNLTAVILLTGGLLIFGWDVATRTWDGTWILSVLMVAGFVGINAWTEHD